MNKEELKAVLLDEMSAAFNEALEVSSIISDLRVNTNDAVAVYCAMSI